MGITLSGMTSGLDTDAIIEALVATKVSKKESLQKEQTKLQWKQDAWSALNTKIYNFYSKTLSNMRLASNYNKKSTSVSNTSVASITANSNSVNGTQTLGVQQLAKAGYLTGGKLSMSGGKVSSDTKLSDLGITKDTSFNIEVAGQETVVNLKSDMKVSDVVSALRDAGVNASFDATNQRFFVSSKESGADNDFSLTAANSSGINALKSLGLYCNSSKENAQYAQWAAYSQDEIDAMVAKAYTAAMTDTAKETEILQNEIESLGKQNETLVKTQTKQQAQYDYACKYLDSSSTAESRLEEYNKLVEERKELKAKDSLTETETARLNELDTQISAIETVDKAIGSETLTDEDRQTYVDELKKAIDSTQETITKNEEAMLEDQNILEGTGSKTVDDIVAEKNAATLANLTQEYQDKYETAKAYQVQSDYLKDGAHTEISVTDAETKKAAYEQRIADGDTLTDEEQAEYDYVSSVSKIGNISGTANTDGTGATRIVGQNAIIYLNDAKFESNDNTFSVNGLTITAQELTGYDENNELKTVSITTKTDNQAVYDMVKNFFKEYNELVNEMDKLYNADSAKDYEPLTDDEKKDMSDSEIEKWETKIKDSLLRRDTTLSDVTQVLKTTLSAGININGKQHYLSDYGIKTLGYLTAAENERGAYHIDGDSDDSSVSGKSDKLLAAIMDNPDEVAEVFSGIAQNLYDKLFTKMRSTTMSSIYKVYNDKQMKTDYNNYTTRIAEQEEKISWWESYYRSRFSSMESMLSSLNSQQSALSGLLG